jgi:SAM-dependent methyltransferase
MTPSVGVASGNTLDRAYALTGTAHRGLGHSVSGYLRWVPPRIDMSVPHPARMHDYWLGGGHNFAADRELADKIKEIMPGIEDVSRLNQAFLRRAALFLVESGIRQFLDIGSGIPTVGNLHDIVQRAEPDCRVVYVDGDPVSVAHTELIVENSEGTEVLQGDIREIGGILDSDLTRSLIDLSQPVGLVAPAMHFIPDSSEPACLLASYRDRLAPGSYLVLAHSTTDGNVQGQHEIIEAYNATRYRLYPRPYEMVLAMTSGFELVEPGLVGFAHWRTESPGDLSTHPGLNSLLYAAVGRKP